MEDLNQQYKELLNKKVESLEREKRKEYEYLVDDLSRRGMVREGIHIEQALELEITFLRRFIDYALSLFKKLINSPEAKSDTLEKACRENINLFFSKSLKRMLGIIEYVRSPLTDDYVKEPLEKIRSDALKELEIMRAKSHSILNG